MTTLWIDFETFNEVDIKVGGYKYAETAEILLCAWAIDDGPAQVWDLMAEGIASRPSLLADALLDPDVQIVAHNAQFDRTILRHVWQVLGRHGAGEPERWRCTMVKALMHGFPGSLGQLCQILGVDEDKTKIKEGKKLINRFCKPAPKSTAWEKYDPEAKKAGKTRAEIGGAFGWRFGPRTHPEEWERFKDYARQDIDAMREVDKRLPWFNEKRELPLYHLDQQINDRGFYVDQDLVSAGAAAAETEKDLLRQRFRTLTGGLVDRPSMREEFRTYLNATYGTEFADTKKSTFESYLRDNPDAPKTLAELLAISMEANKTSTSKYATLGPAVSSDGRMRGTLQFCGAARTRRWAGRIFQPQNLPSRGLPDQSSIDLYVDALKAGVQDLLFDDLMLYGSAALRSAVTASDGDLLHICDLSNIEGRVLAWLAGERWKLEAFAAFDQGEGHDLYKVTAGRILGKPPEDVTKPERNSLGKVSELALGYQGGAGAYQTFAAGYGMRMSDYSDVIKAEMPDAWNQAFENWELWGSEKAGDTPIAEWMPAEAIKLGWRAANVKIEALWHACEEAFRRAYNNPGKMYRAGPHLKFKALEHEGHNYLVVRLPSGGLITYFDPRIDENGRLSHMGVDQLTRQWRRIDTYGGKIVENCTQSLARDVLAASMLRAEDEGFEIVLSVHDEIIAEAPADRDPNELIEIMARGEDWTEGLPLAADGFAEERYRK